ncbi:phage protein [Leminorella grimontii ATCC 33999 = DSM 5078]|nr:phage protein [Leminorella grimontii ATCC 33999 = DSM 5078]
MVNGIEIPGGKSTFVAVGVKAEYSPHEIDGTVILTGDIRVTFKAEPEIKVGDVVDIDSVKWRVMQPNPIKPASLVLCYKAQLRRVNG